MPTKLDLKQVPKLKENAIFKDLPDKLKDVKNFHKIEKELSAMMKSDHAHKTIKAFVSCAWCQKKLELKQNRMKAIGFKDYSQYMEWRKIMMIIINKANFQIR